jgi:BolA protein
MNNIKKLIETKLQLLQPQFLEVINESHMHAVPQGSESHFKVTIVSDEFNGKILLARHRMINKILIDELTHSIHALVLHTMTINEWFDKNGASNNSPPCLGGSISK